jgi:ABC-type multidrug transport system ATPase subunit
VPAVELKRVGKLYGRIVALKNIDLRLEPGDVLALLGSNGSGKTTLLKILAGAILPTLGGGSIYGFDLISARADIRTLVGLLAGQTHLYEDLTAHENLRFTGVMAGRDASPVFISDLLSEVGLAGRGNERVRTFSSGMRRRLSLARVQLLRPRLLLLDEPYNSLDASGMALIDDMVRRARAAQSTAIIATHDADRALQLATTVLALERGSVSYRGPVLGYARRGAKYVG